MATKDGVIHHPARFRRHKPPHNQRSLLRLQRTLPKIPTTPTLRRHPTLATHPTTINSTPSRHLIHNLNPPPRTTPPPLHKPALHQPTTPATATQYRRPPHHPSSLAHHTDLPTAPQHLLDNKPRISTSMGRWRDIRLHSREYGGHRPLRPVFREARAAVVGRTRRPGRIDEKNPSHRILYVFILRFWCLCYPGMTFTEKG